MTMNHRLTPRPPSRSMPVVAAVVALAAVACGSSTEPTATPTSFDLATYGGSAPPVELRLLVMIPVDPGGATITCSEQLVAQRMTLNGAYFKDTQSRVTICPDGRPNKSDSTLIRGSVARSGSAITLTSDLGAGTVYRATGTLNGDTLVIQRREVQQSGGATSIDQTTLVFVAPRGR